MHPDITRGTADYRITRSDADADADSRCPSSGMKVGKMIEIPGSDDGKIECPRCGTFWHGGSTVLAEHNRRR